MEDLLHMYTLNRTIAKTLLSVCMDESSIQALEKFTKPLSADPDPPELINDEYVRKGVSSIFLEVEPLGGKRQVKIIER
jgi:hypothetical protein